MGTGTCTPKNFNGKVELSYSVADSHGAATEAKHSVEIKVVMMLRTNRR